MDPDTTWHTVHDPTADPTDRIAAAEALVEWLDRGGFPPAGLYAHRVRIACVQVREALTTHADTGAPEEYAR